MNGATVLSITAAPLTTHGQGVGIHRCDTVVSILFVSCMTTLSCQNCHLSWPYIPCCRAVFLLFEQPCVLAPALLTPLGLVPVSLPISRPCLVSDLSSSTLISTIPTPFLEQNKTRSLSDSRALILTTEDLKITRIQKLEKPLHHVPRVARCPLLTTPLRPPLCLDRTRVGRIFTVYTYEKRPGCIYRCIQFASRMFFLVSF